MDNTGAVVAVIESKFSHFQVYFQIDYAYHLVTYIVMDYIAQIYAH